MRRGRRRRGVDRAGLLDAAQRRGVPLTHVGADVVETPGRFGADVVLVRPDQHIAWLGAAPAPAQADLLLDAVLRDGLLEAPAPTPTRSTRTAS